MDQHLQVFQREFSQFLAAAVSLPDSILRDFELCSCFKESEHRATYLIRSRADGERYILKCGDQAASHDLETEYRFLSSLSHPSFPHLVSFSQQNEHSYFIREYIEGVTLSEYVEQAGSFTETAAINAVLALCDALEYLHRQTPPVIHRDIKPQNIIFTPKHSIRLIDFGTARRYQSGVKKDTTCLGTEATAAPEQFGYQQTDSRSDIYSIGVLLIFLCTGLYDLEACQTIQNRRLRRVIETCTRFDPNHRYKSVKQLRKALSLAAKPINRNVILYLRGALVGLAVGVGLSFLLFPRISPPSSVPAAAAADRSPVAEQAVDFASPQIAQAVRAQLGYPDDAALYPSDLDRVTKLFIFGSTVLNEWSAVVNQSIYTPESPQGDIDSLADIPKFHNLAELAIINQKIADLSPLQGLHLTRLSLDKNQIIDLTPISTMPDLTELYIGDNPIYRVDALQGCASLRKLDLSESNVINIQSLPDNLTQLLLNETPVDDYSHLLEMPSLERLFVSHLSVKNLAIVSQLTGLTELELHDNLPDLAPLLGLTNMERLTITHTTLQSIAGIEALPNLRHLCIEGVPDLDLSPLAQLDYLTSLDIYAQSLSDYSAIFQIPTLQTLFCSAQQRDEIEALGMDHAFDFQVIG